jgi:uncharacterized protein YajQ (UPF0234 family)
MAGQVSFDITSSVDLQEVDNAVNQAKKEIAQRYDFKGSKAEVELKKSENLIELVADDAFKMDALWDVLQTRMIRRGVPVKNLKLSDLEKMGGSLVKRKVTLQQGIPSEAAKDIVKFIKDQKLRKVQAAIQGDQLRVSSPSKDELQSTMALLRGQDFGVELSFGNYRE